MNTLRDRVCDNLVLDRDSLTLQGAMVAEYGAMDKLRLVGG
jgi:hypothetical protein